MHINEIQVLLMTRHISDISVHSCTRYSHYIIVNKNYYID